MFEGQPKGLWALALANTGERFGYYTMLAVFLLYLQANFHYEAGLASTIYSTFLMMVYFLPVIGGIAADRFGFGKMVTTGIFIMFIGYLLLSVPLGGDLPAAAAMAVAGPAAGAAAADAPAAEEQTEFTVVLKEVGGNKIAVIKAVREITGLGLGEAKALVDGAPATVKEAMAKEAANEAVEKLKAAGATAELK